MSTFPSAFASDFNIVSMVCGRWHREWVLTIFCVCVLFTIASIIFENVNTDVHAKSECALRLDDRKGAQ